MRLESRDIHHNRIQTLQRLIWFAVNVLDELTTDSHNFTVSNSHSPSAEHFTTGVCRKFSKQDPVDDSPSPGLPTAF